MPKKFVADVLPDLPRLPRLPQVGDRIRLKEDKRAEYREACRLAGWDFDPAKTYVVQRDDGFLPGGGRRLFIDVPPHALSSRDVEFAWLEGAQGKDRRAFLRSKGMKV